MRVSGFGAGASHRVGAADEMQCLFFAKECSSRTAPGGCRPRRSSLSRRLPPPPTPTPRRLPPQVRQHPDGADFAVPSRRERGGARRVRGAPARPGGARHSGPGAARRGAHARWAAYVWAVIFSWARLQGRRAARNAIITQPGGLKPGSAGAPHRTRPFLAAASSWPRFGNPPPQPAPAAHHPSRIGGWQRWWRCCGAITAPHSRWSTSISSIRRARWLSEGFRGARVGCEAPTGRLAGGSAVAALRQPVVAVGRRAPC